MSSDFTPCDWRATLGETNAYKKFNTWLEFSCGSKWATFKQKILTFGKCEVQIPTQSLLSAGTFANGKGSYESGTNYEVEHYGGYLEVATGWNLKYQVTIDEGVCPFEGVGSYSYGRYTGTYGLFGELPTGGYIPIWGAHF